MQKSIFSASIFILSLGGALSSAEEHLSYTCSTTLDYKVKDSQGQTIVKSIPMSVTGVRTAAGALGAATASAGERWNNYNGISGYVYDDALSVSAYLNTGEGFSLTYMGSGSPLNWAKYEVPSDGSTFVITNDILGAKEPGAMHEVTCDIEQPTD